MIKPPHNLSDIKKSRQIIKTQPSMSSQPTDGNSEFVKSKLDAQYKPTYRIRMSSLSPYSQSDFSSKNIKFLQKKEDEKLTYLLAKEAIKRGEKIIIDWSTKTKFRSTKFKFRDPFKQTALKIKKLAIENSKDSKCSPISSNSAFFSKKI